MYFFTSRTFTTMYFSAMSEMFPDLSEPLPHTVSPTTHTWNKVDQDIAQHTYNIHYDMITKLQNEVKELSTKVLQNQEHIKLLQMSQRTHHTTTTNNTSHVTAKQNAVVRYYASPPLQPLLKKKKVYNPYEAIKMKKQARVPHSKLAEWPRK